MDLIIEDNLNNMGKISKNYSALKLVLNTQETMKKTQIRNRYLNTF